MEMQGSRSKNPKAFGSEKPRLIMVLVGILLFVVGFLVTLASVQSDHAASSGYDNSANRGSAGSPASTGAYLLGGILISLVGVVLATVGPAAAIVRGKG